MAQTTRYHRTAAASDEFARANLTVSPFFPAVQVFAYALLLPRDATPLKLDALGLRCYRWDEWRMVNPPLLPVAIRRLSSRLSNTAAVRCLHIDMNRAIPVVFQGAGGNSPSLALGMARRFWPAFTEKIINPFL